MSWNRAVTKAQFEERAKPRLLLFLSVDMENSTRLKQNASQQYEEGWLNTVVGFLEDFPTLFSAKVEEVGRNAQWSEDTRRKPWKVLGDEMIFVYELSDRAGAEREVMALMQAIEAWNDSTKTDAGKLPLKGTGWLAGFPVANAALPMKEGYEDYVGPSIDAGFRLSKTATPRRFVLSVELAWWLLTCKTNMAIHFEGRQMIKGVAEGNGYPLLWVEIKVSEYQRKEDELLGRNFQPNRDDTLLQLCQAFIEEFGVPRIPPFLYSETDAPPDYKVKLKAARDHLARSFYLITEEDGSEDKISAEAMRLLLSKLDAAATTKPP